MYDEVTVNGVTCSNEISFIVTINPLPTPTMIAAVEECDDDNDGEAIFDLTTDVTTDIINGQPFIALSFHETLAEAEAGTIASIPNPASYQSSGRTVWVRAFDTDPATSTQCFSIIEITLVVNPAPVLPVSIADIDICDSDADGQEIIDITANEAAIFGTQSPTDFNLTYHLTLTSATAAVGSPSDTPIASPTSQLIMANPTVPTTIFVRLENTTTGCTNVGEFDVVTGPLPNFTSPPATLEVCDMEGAGLGTDDDGISIFDLISLNASITAGDPDLSITYFLSQADLDNGVPITSPDAFINTSNPQTILIEVVDTVNGVCDAHIPIDLVVNSLPVLPEPLTAVTTCDDDDDGFGEFDLQAYESDLLATFTNISDLRFYETLANAQVDNGNGELDVTQPYNNISIDAELFIVAENTTACTRIFPVDLIVFPVPEFTIELTNITQCDDNQDGQELFDLNEVLNGQDLTGLTPTYHTSQASAEDITPSDAPFDPINNPANYLSSGTPTTPETIWVRLQNDDGTLNTCFAVESFELIVEPLPVINPTAEDLNQALCDDNEDEVATFDLTLNENLITGQNGALSVEYYGSLDDLNNDNPIVDPTAYDNIENPQKLYRSW